MKSHEYCAVCGCTIPNEAVTSVWLLWETATKHIWVSGVSIRWHEILDRSCNGIACNRHFKSKGGRATLKVESECPFFQNPPSFHQMANGLRRD